MKFTIDRSQAVARASAVRLLLLDVDGVMTDGRLHIGADGSEAFKSFHSLDGQGIKQLQSAGIPVGIVTGRQSAIVTQRAAELGIGDVIQGQTDKLAGMGAICAAHGVTAAEVCYVGDDLPDLPAMARAGLALTVPNAHPSVIAMAAGVSERPGGAGGVREVCDFLLDCRR